MLKKRKRAIVLIVDAIGNHSRYLPCHKDFKSAFAFILKNAKEPLEPGRYDIDGDRVYAMVQSYETVSADGRQLETHKKYIDIQYIQCGVERMGYSALTEIGEPVKSDAESDIYFYSEEPSTWIPVNSGSFAVFFPQDAHMPSISIADGCNVIKIIVKVAIQ